MQKRVTQRDVAARAGVSQAAVSRVMAEHGYVAEDVRARIMEAAAALGYRPDPVARTLITGRSNIVAVVVGNVVNPFFPVALSALTEALRQEDREVLLFNAAPGQNPGEISFVSGFRGQGADINDPAASGGGNSGGSIDLPFNLSPDEMPAVTFGGWVNVETNNGFPGFMAIDNGGWDRGIHMQDNWSVASGGTTNNIAPVAIGQISGFGPKDYLMALDAISERLEKT